MGSGKLNVEATAHGQDDWGNELTLRLHYGNISLDSTSPTLPVTDRNALKAAITTQTAFEEEIADIGGLFEAWWDSWSSAYHDAIYQTMKREWD